MTELKGEIYNHNHGRFKHPSLNNSQNGKKIAIYIEGQNNTINVI